MIQSFNELSSVFPDNPRPAHLPLLPEITTSIRPGYSRATLQNYSFVVKKGNGGQSGKTKDVSTYSSIVARVPDTWEAPKVSVVALICLCDSTDSLQEMSAHLVDVMKCVNETTVGPYSFRIFVDSNWSQKRLDSTNGGQPLKAGRRKKIRAGNAVLKRPLASAIPFGQSSKQRGPNLLDSLAECGSDDSTLGSSDGFDISHDGGRVTRQRRGKENRMRPY